MKNFKNLFHAFLLLGLFLSHSWSMDETKSEKRITFHQAMNFKDDIKFLRGYLDGYLDNGDQAEALPEQHRFIKRELGLSKEGILDQCKKTMDRCDKITVGYYTEDEINSDSESGWGIRENVQDSSPSVPLNTQWKTIFKSLAFPHYNPKLSKDHLHEMHKSGDVWPKRYLGSIFQHGFLNSCIGEFLNVSLSKLYKILFWEPEGTVTLKSLPDLISKSNESYLDDTNFTSGILGFSGVESTKNLTLGDLQDLKFGVEVMLSFIEGLQSNKLLIHVGATYQQGKIKEEKIEKAYEQDPNKIIDIEASKKCEYLQHILITWIKSAVDIFKEKTKKIGETPKEERTPWKKMTQEEKLRFSQDLNVFFSNFFPTITDGIDPIPLETYGFLKKKDYWGDSDAESKVPQALRTIVDNEENWPAFSRKFYTEE